MLTKKWCLILRQKIFDQASKAGRFPFTATELYADEIEKARSNLERDQLYKTLCLSREAFLSISRYFNVKQQQRKKRKFERKNVNNWL